MLEEEKKVKKHILKDQYRQENLIFLNLSKEESAKLFGFKISNSQKNCIKSENDLK